jgi:hypothetical protein
MSEHSLLSPSSAVRWMRCPGSLVLSKSVEETVSAYADEGTQAHALAETFLRSGEFVAARDVVEAETIDPEMWRPVADYVRAVRKMTEGAIWIAYEQRVDLSEALGVADTSGTADCAAIVKRELQVHDLKYGRGVRVSPVNNPQEMLYALGVYKIAVLISEIDTIKLVIHQPRLNEEPIEWSITPEVLMDFGRAAAALAQRAMMVYNSNTVSDDAFCPGVEQCRFCTLKATCRYLAHSNMQAIYDEFDDLCSPKLPERIKENAKSVNTLTPNEIGKVLAMQDAIEMWLKAIGERANAILNTGGSIPGWKLVEGRAAARKWSDEKKVEVALKAMRLKSDEMYDWSVISVAKAEKLLSDVRFAKLESLITRGSPGTKIVPESDKRPAIELQRIESEFDDLTTNQKESV